MENPKFRLSEMIPNSWFPKLNHIGNPKSTPKPHQSPKQNHPAPSQTPPLSSIRITRGDPSPEFQGELPLHPDPISPPRKSYYFTREFHSKLKYFDSPEKSINPPLKSTLGRRRRRPKSTIIRHSPVSSPDHCDPPSVTFTQMVSLPSSSPNCRPDSCIIDEESDFVIEVDDKSLGRRKIGDSVSNVELRPIRTERNKFGDLVKKIGGAQAAIDEPIKQKSSPKFRGRRANGSLSVNVAREDSMASSVSFNEPEQEQGSRSVRRSPSGSPLFKIRVHSPRIARRAQVHSSRGSLPNSVSKKGVSSKSLAVVKSSCNPQRDFRESMVEMIVENKITSAKDLEELLACYLSLNSDQYHDVIIQVFAQIWFDLNNILKEIKK